MRKSLAGVWTVAALVAACGGFGSEDEEAPAPTPIDNSQPPPPPVDGKPIPGIYVSVSKGRGGNTGFPGSPLPSLKEGFARAKQENLRLIVCAEEYAENVELIDGVSAYGYYDCNVEPWVRVTKRARVKAPISPAMSARDIKLPTRVEGFEIIAPDLDATTAKDREGSSIGLDARKVAPNTLIVSDSLVHGGKAAAGSDGAVAIAPRIKDGQSARGTNGYDESSSSCQPTMIACASMKVPGVKGPAPECDFGEAAPGPGGDGGDGVWFIDFNLQEDQPYNDVRGRPFTATTATAAGAPGCSPNATLCKGSNGAQAPEGANGANGVWRFDADGFVLGNGTRGGSGTPGQGGGGGGGAPGWNVGGGAYGNPPRTLGGTGYFRSARGGSGGAGGCGGLAGGAGGGGGASIGGLLLDAEVRFERTIVESSNGGRAGSGSLGSFGGSGGAGGTGGIGAGAGGDGGRGGVGGSSGHGAAGPSIAIAWRGLRALKDGQTGFVAGTGGEGRAALSQSIGPPFQTIAAMPLGASIPEYEIK